jgi:A/G-specific adenine glycosylase
MAITEKKIPKSKGKRGRKVDVPSVRAHLLAWYDVAHRDLPWRQNPDPYRIWVSEVMLQQTRVDVVTPYFIRWMERFPTLEDLARAEPDTVLKQWEGLGYYSRARNLHGAARLVREQHAGVMPASFDRLRALPGIGDYTAGAVASIAYGEPVAAVDGNVRRVLSRLFDVSAPSAAAVRDRARDIVDRERPGDFNQAVMELGATVCTPRNPACAACPLESMCLARALGTVPLRPGVKPKRVIPRERVNTLVVLNDGCVLLVRRQAGLLAGLWAFPEVARVPAHARRIGEITHVFSHKRITYVVHFTSMRTRPRRAGEWVRLDELNGYALPAAQRKIERLVRSVL